MQVTNLSHEFTNITTTENTVRTKLNSRKVQHDHNESNLKTLVKDIGDHSNKLNQIEEEMKADKEREERRKKAIDKANTIALVGAAVGGLMVLSHLGLIPNLPRDYLN